MFELYKNNTFVMYYENQNSQSGFTHLLNVKNLSTGEVTRMWVDPTGSDTDPKILDKITHLQDLKGVCPDQETYNHQVAHFIEALIENTGYSSLKISSLMKDALKHHRAPQHLYETIQRIDLSRFRDNDQEDILNSFNIQDIKVAVAEFIAILTETVCGLLGIAPPSNSETTIAETTVATQASALRRFGKFPDTTVAYNQETTHDLEVGQPFSI